MRFSTNVLLILTTIQNNSCNHGLSLFCKFLCLFCKSITLSKLNQFELKKVCVIEIGWLNYHFLKPQNKLEIN